jgi:hypothetical protein
VLQQHETPGAIIIKSAISWKVALHRPAFNFSHAFPYLLPVIRVLFGISMYTHMSIKYVQPPQKNCKTTRACEL